MMPNRASILLDIMVTAVDEGFSPDGIVSVPEMGLEDAAYRPGLAGLWDRAMDTLQSFPRAFRRQTRSPPPPPPSLPPPQSPRPPSGNDTSPVDSKISSDGTPKSPGDALDEEPVLPSPVVNPISPLPEATTTERDPRRPSTAQTSITEGEGSSPVSSVPGARVRPATTTGRDPRRPNTAQTSTTQDEGSSPVLSAPGVQARPATTTGRDPRRPNTAQTSTTEGQGSSQVSSTPGAQVRPATTTGRDPRRPNTAQTSTTEGQGSSQVSSTPGAQVRPVTSEQGLPQPNVPASTSDSAQVPSAPSDQVRQAGTYERDPRLHNVPQASPVPASGSEGGVPVPARSNVSGKTAPFSILWPGKRS